MFERWLVCLRKYKINRKKIETCSNYHNYRYADEPKYNREKTTNKWTYEKCEPKRCAHHTEIFCSFCFWSNIANHCLYHSKSCSTDSSNQARKEKKYDSYMKWYNTQKAKEQEDRPKSICKTRQKYHWTTSHTIRNSPYPKSNEKC